MAIRDQCNGTAATRSLYFGLPWNLDRPPSDHFDGTRFFNPGSRQAKGLLDVLRWKTTSRPGSWPECEQPVETSAPPGSVDSGCRVTFINHSTLLIQFDGQNILTDPIWSERASPVSWAGPRRRSRPGVQFEDLPRIDRVLISHNHYDHLDLPTLRRLAHSQKPRFTAPLGVADVLASVGIEAGPECDWWDSSGPVTCLPAQHFSARSIRDRNKTLWCSYWIDTPAGGVYFAADTGFGPHFAEIRRRMGAPRLSLLPIGAYQPRWFMSAVHMSPADAVEAHRILESARSIGIHWGTFALADDGRDDPVQDLKHALTEHPGLRPFEAIPNGAWVEVD